MDAAPDIEEPAPSESPARFHLYGPDFYLKPPPPIEWDVENVIVAGGLMLMVGESGSKKTYSAMDMAYCKAIGKPWLGHETRPGKVIYLDEESGLKRMHWRAHEVAKGHYGNATVPFYFSTYNGLNLIDDREEERLYELIRLHQPDMLVIDTLAAVTPGADENAVKDMHKPMARLHRLATYTGVTVVLIHHAGKSGKYRGSSTIKADVDTMLIVESEDESDVINFSFEKLRDGNPSKFAARTHWEDGGFWLTETEPTERERPMSKSQRYVLRFLQENGPSDMNSIRENADICSPNAARQAVYSLADMGLVTRINEGGRGHPAKYSLVSKQVV
jgi:predicted transcriptional regulator